MHHRKKLSVAKQLSLAIALLMIAAGCGVFEQRVNEPAAPTRTPLPFSTATPGGRISVWMDERAEVAINPEGTLISSDGEMVAPVATATAIQQAFLDATATAQAPTPQPIFQPDNCPEIRGIPAPLPPDSFSTYPAALSLYLSNGGAPSVLESTLRDWGAITERGGVVQADTDLTGDKTPEILVNIFNPFAYNEEAVLNAGQLLIFGCENDAYRLLYSTPNNAGFALPVLHRVGDMNADINAEIVYDIQSCTTAFCTREGFVVAWNPSIGAFEPINSQQILSINGRLGVVDVDSDGILEINVSTDEITSSSAGPTRGFVDTWDWTGQNYLLAARNVDEARYRIHRLHDGDGEFYDGNFSSALRAYFDVRDDGSLLPWTLPNETELLRAFATYRIVTTYARLGDGRADDFLNRLLSENPEGSSGNVFAAMGLAFMDAYRASGREAGCAAARDIAAGRGESLGFLNSYGSANPSYTLSDLCPF